MRSKTEGPHVRPCSLVLIVLLASVACLAGAILALNASPRLLILLLGLKPVDSVPRVLPPEPAPLTLDGQPLDHIDFVLPPRVAEPLTLYSSDVAEDPLLDDPLVGNTSSLGTTTYLLGIDEDSLNRLLQERVLPGGPDNGRYRNLAIDLRSGGLVIYADVDLVIRRQRMGLLLLQDKGALTLSPVGIIMDGTLYSLPESGSVARFLLPTGRQLQRALHALTIVGPLPGEARVDRARFQDDRLQILAEATYAVSAPSDTGWQLLERGAELRQLDVPVSAEGPAERLSIVRLQPTEFTLQVRYEPTNPKTISAWAAALDAYLVVNGSYFAPEGEGGSETVGLLVSDGQRWGTPLQSYAGMVAVTGDGQVSVRWLQDRPYDPQEPLVQAIQSFPMLVKPGGVLGFPAEADDGATARRTVVAQDANGNLLLVVAPRGMLSLHELAVFLVESDLAIDVALNLDGGGSSGMWLAAPEAKIEIDSFTPVPSIIAVERY